MPTMLTLTRIDFDSAATNSTAALQKKVVARFLDAPGRLASQKMDEYLSKAFIKPLYRGWDSKVYPQFELTVEQVK